MDMTIDIGGRKVAVETLTDEQIEGLTDEQVRSLFDTTRLVCADCGFEFDPAESADYDADPDSPEWGEPYPSALAYAMAEDCPDCRSSEVREIPVNLLDELVRQSDEFGETARWLVERKPDMREAVEQRLAQARDIVDSILVPA